FDRRIVGLTGSPAEIAAAAKQYRVFYKKSSFGNSDDYSMDHSPYIYLMGPDGGYVTLFSPDQSRDQIEARLRELLIIAAADNATADSPNARTTSSGD